METVAVIGSNSFSGSDLVDLLLTQRDYRVLGISRSPEKSELFLPYQRNPNLSRFTFYQMDMNNDMEGLKHLLSREKPSYIVNFAAQSEVAPSWQYPEQWFQTNAVAIAALGNYLKDKKWLKRYVHISSPEVYGTCQGIVKEDARLNPSTPYAASKAAGDLMLLTLVKQYNFPMAMIRATNVYGAHQQLFKIIPKSVIRLKQNKVIELHGGGVAVKSYINIRDVSRGEMLAMEQGDNGETYHLSPDSGVSVHDLVRMICRLMGRDFEKATVNVGERPGQDAAYVIDSTRARERFGWQPKISLEDGLHRVIDWVDDNWGQIRKEPAAYAHKP